MIDVHTLTEESIGNLPLPKHHGHTLFLQRPDSMTSDARTLHLARFGAGPCSLRAGLPSDSRGCCGGGAGLSSAPSCSTAA